MNRNNLFGHLAIAIAVIILAAFAGQMRRINWNSQLSAPPPPPPQQEQARGTDDTDGDCAEDTNDPDCDKAEGTDTEGEDDAEVIVRFKPGTSLEQINQLTAKLHDRLEDRLEYVDNEAIIADEDGLDAETVASQYRALPEVVYAEPNYEINLDPAEDETRNWAGDGETAGAEHGPNDPLFAEQWSLQNTGQNGGKAGADIGALRAWDKTTGSDKIVVAVLDTGVDYKHLDLMHNIWMRPANVAEYKDDDLGTIDDQHGFNATDQDGDPMDDNGHGTHCAGIIGAEGDNSDGIAGVNWKVEIMPLKFLNANGSGTTKDAIECINYAIDRKRAGVNLRIISASWGSTTYSRSLEDAIRAAGKEGILFVAAAGNSRTDNDRMPHYPSSYNLPNVVSVAALNRRDELASFSNYGLKSVHVAAPGAEILSTWPGNQYEEHSGTSMATPEVSGVAALVLSLDPNLSMEKLRERLLSSVDKIPALDGKVSSGGRINAARAVKAE